MERKKILCVDDSNTFLKLLQIYLDRDEYEIFSAPDGQKAIENISKVKPDLIILDLIMPLIEGDRVCKFVKSEPSLAHIPVIMITTRGDKEGKTRCLSAGCDVFLTKPLLRSEIVSKVKKVLCP